MVTLEEHVPASAVKKGAMVVKVDEVLKQLGSPGRFQIVIFILLCCNYMPLVFNHVIMAFFASRVPYVCSAAGNQNYLNISGQETKIEKIENTKCKSNLYLENSVNVTFRCTGGDWSFKPMPRETTITMEVNSSW